MTAVAQSDDRGYLTSLLEDNLSGEGHAVTINGFEGALSSQATIANLTIADDQGIWLTVNGVALDWNRAALLTGRVSVNALTADEIILERLPAAQTDAIPSPEAQGFSLPELPVSIEIGKIAAARLELGESVIGTALEARLEAALTLDSGDGTAKLLLERTDDGPGGKIDLTAAYTQADRQLSVDLAAQEGAGGIAATLLGLPGEPAVDLTVQGSGPLEDFTADVRLETNGQPRLAGEISLKGDGISGLNFNADLGGDLAPLFLPDYAEFFGPDVRLHSSGTRTADGRLDLRELAVETRALRLQGALVLGVDNMPERFNLTGSLGLDGKPVLLPLSREQRTEVSGADLALNFDAAKGNGWTGSATVQGLQRADFSAQTMKIAGSGRIDRSVGGTGNASLGGTLNYEAVGLLFADTALALATGQTVNGSVTLLWQEAVDGISLPKVTLRGEDYVLDGGARIKGLKTGLTVTGRAKATAEDIARLSALAGRDLAGQASVTASGTAALLAGTFDIEAQVQGNDLTVDQPEADSLLRGPSVIDLAVRRDENGTVLRRFDLAAQSLTAKALGKIATAGTDVEADLNFTDLSALGPKYHGTAVGKARFVGAGVNGDVTLDIKGDGIAVGIEQLDNLLRGTSSIVMDAGIFDQEIDLRTLKVVAPSLSADLSGKASATHYDLKAGLSMNDLGVLGLGYRGALSGKATFAGTREDASLTVTALGDDLAIGQAEADALLRGQSQVDADLRVLGTRITINNFSVKNAQVSAEAKGAIAGGTRTVDLSARLANLAVLLPEFPGAVTVQGRAIENADGYQLDLTGTGPGQLDARVSGTLAPDMSRGDLEVKGTAQAGLANAFIDPRTVSGPVSFDLRLNGPLELSSLSGRASLNGGRVAHPDLPFSFNDVAATADLSGGRVQLQARTGVSSGGTIALRGTASLSAPFNGDLTVDLTQVVIKDPTLYETRLNGSVTMNGPLAGGAVIAGRIFLNETELRIPSTGLGGAGGLDGLIHLHESAAVRATRARAGMLDVTATGTSSRGTRPYPLDIVISAPNRLFLRGRGLDAELGGELRLGGTTANLVPSGAFNLVRGRLDILGKRLTLSEALLQLQGDYIPFVRILASNENDGITSSVLIEGEASEPKISFVSQPQLPEEEVLSQLLFGRDLTSISAFQAAQLAAAVATLAGKGGDGVLSKLRQGFGLDDLDLDTDGTGGTSVKAGKYLSKNLYTEIVVDQDGQSEVHLNLDLTDSITLRGSAGSNEGTGIGIFMEKDY